MADFIGYNSMLVLCGALVLGALCGLVGSFIYLRKNTLISDATSHATLPGIGLGFLLAFLLGWEQGRHLPTLLAGAALTGAMAAFTIGWIQRNTRLNNDVAVGAVLSVFYGAGIVLLSYIQRLENASQAALDSFLLGQIAGMSIGDLYFIFALAAVALACTLVLLKELTLLCFDEEFAHSAGMSVSKVDVALIFLMLGVVCVGLRMVGLILILALLIIPPVTARLWTDRLSMMLVLSSAIGGLCALSGAYLSASIDHLPAGAAIVLCAAAVFFPSVLIRGRVAAA